MYTTFNKNLGQTDPCVWKCPRTQFWGPLTNWKFEPSPRARTHSDPIINKRTEHVWKLGMDSSWHALNSMLQVKTFYRTENQGFLKKFKTYPLKPTEAEPSFRKVNLPPAKLRMLFPTQLWVSFWFWLQLYSLWQALDWGLMSKILACTKVWGA